MNLQELDAVVIVLGSGLAAAIAWMVVHYSPPDSTEGRIK